MQSTEGIDIESEEVPEALSQALDTLRQYLVTDIGVQLPSSDTALARAISSEILMRMSLAPKAFAVMKDAAAVMLSAGADHRAMQVNIIKKHSLIKFYMQHGFRDTREKCRKYTSKILRRSWP